MKNLITTTLLGLGFFILAGQANAQLDSPIELKTKFAFTVGDATFPAGSYVIRLADNEPGLLEISTQDGKHSAVFNVEPVKTRPKGVKSEVIFKKYDDKYVLSEIWEEYADEGVVTIKSRFEAKAEKKNPDPGKESVATNRSPAPVKTVPR